MKTAYFTRFTLDLPPEAVAACSHQGQCKADAEFWATRIERPTSLTPDTLRAELKEYGTWDADELADDEINWHRIIWLAAGNIQDEERATKQDANVQIEYVFPIQRP